MSPRAGAPLHGVLVVDKPTGPTSHRVVGQARRLYGSKRVGHAGTLDPLASGVLILLFGQATKLSAHLTAQRKRYYAELTLGVETDTLDSTGEISARHPVSTDEIALRLEAALVSERARRLQRPPAFSAIHVNGERAHRRSRRGESVDLPQRPIVVHDLRLATPLASLSADAPRLGFELTVSKGYYVRSFARDLGRALGTGAHLSALRRVASGSFGIDEAHPWPPPFAPPTPMAVGAAARRALPSAQLTAEGVYKARRGQTLTSDNFETPEVAALHEQTPVAWFGDEQLVALGQLADGRYTVVRGFETIR